MLRWLTLMLLLLSACGDRVMPPDPTCANPRDATDSLLAWQHPGSYDLGKATACMDTPPGQDARRLAVHLKEVLDARGLWVPVPELSDEPDYKDEEGRHQLVPMPEFPAMVIVRGRDGKWRYSRATLEQVERLYASTISPLGRVVEEATPPVLQRPVMGIRGWQAIYAVLLVLGAWLIGQLVRVVVFRQVLNAVRRAGLRLDRDAYDRTNGPVLFLTMCAVLLYGAPDLRLPIEYSRLIMPTVQFLFVAASAVAALRFVDVLASIGADWTDRTPSKLDNQLVPLLSQTARIIVLFLCIVALLDTVGVDVWKLAAGVGIGGLAFALAAQDTVSNLFGSVNIFVDKPFQIGDWVKIGDVEGVVEEVGFRSTRVRTFYNSLITIPNSKITNANVDNLGVRPRRRVSATLSVTYDTPPDLLEGFIDSVRAILAAHPSVQNTYEVHLSGMGDSGLNILLYYHLIVPDWHGELVARAQVYLEILRAAKTLGVSFAFPSTSLYVEALPDKPLKPRNEPAIAELERLIASFGPGGERSRPFGPPIAQPWHASGIEARGSEDG